VNKQRSALEVVRGITSRFGRLIAMHNFLTREEALATGEKGLA
jgi:hypothetical protein